ncbi:hypothetical protein BASA60_001058 [Batrachochytrium salamandrivorans]|nr:hypothetical protein BASA60_001058 [Batrachochytrium salamandrivorans]
MEPQLNQKRCANTSDGQVPATYSDEGRIKEGKWAPMKQPSLPTHPQQLRDLEGSEIHAGCRNHMHPQYTKAPSGDSLYTSSDNHGRRQQQQSIQQQPARNQNSSAMSQNSSAMNYPHHNIDSSSAYMRPPSPHSSQYSAQALQTTTTTHIPYQLSAQGGTESTSYTEATCKGAAIVSSTSTATPTAMTTAVDTVTDPLDRAVYHPYTVDVAPAREPMQRTDNSESVYASMEQEGGRGGGEGGGGGYGYFGQAPEHAGLLPLPRKMKAMAVGPARHSNSNSSSSTATPATPATATPAAPATAPPAAAAQQQAEPSTTAYRHYSPPPSSLTQQSHLQPPAPQHPIYPQLQGQHHPYSHSQYTLPPASHHYAADYPQQQQQQQQQQQYRPDSQYVDGGAAKRHSQYSYTNAPSADVSYASAPRYSESAPTGYSHPYSSSSPGSRYHASSTHQQHYVEPPYPMQSAHASAYPPAHHYSQPHHPEEHYWSQSYPSHPNWPTLQPTAAMSKHQRQHSTEIMVSPPKKRTRAPKEPGAPKHPTSAFLYFLSDVRPSYTLKYPGSTVGPISRMIAADWKALSEETRSTYLEKADHDRERYRSEMGAWIQMKTSRHRPIHGMAEHEAIHETLSASYR